MYKLFICSAVLLSVVFFFFFKQKTAYEMRISDWSSDVCSSDLDITDEKRHAEEAARYTTLLRSTLENISQGLCAFDGDQRLMTWNARFFELLEDRKSVV